MVKTLWMKDDMPRTRTVASAAHTDIWWLEGGSEVCERCLQCYAYEIEVRCVACDAALCPHCALTVTETRESFCPGCEET